MSTTQKTDDYTGGCVPFITKDSGKRAEFSSGMRRDTDENKPRYDLIWQPILKRFGMLMARGAVKYGERNWEKANSEKELNRFKASAYRHFMDWISGDNPEEDHAVGVFFNIMAVEYVKDKLLREAKQIYDKIIPSDIAEICNKCDGCNTDGEQVV